MQHGRNKVHKVGAPFERLLPSALVTLEARGHKQEFSNMGPKRHFSRKDAKRGTPHLGNSIVSTGEGLKPSNGSRPWPHFKVRGVLVRSFHSTAGEKPKTPQPYTIQDIWSQKSA